VVGTKSGLALDSVAAPTARTASKSIVESSHCPFRTTPGRRKAISLVQTRDEAQIWSFSLGNCHKRLVRVTDMSAPSARFDLLGGTRKLGHGLVPRYVGPLVKTIGVNRPVHKPHSSSIYIDTPLYSRIRTSNREYPRTTLSSVDLRLQRLSVRNGRFASIRCRGKGPIQLHFPPLTNWKSSRCPGRGWWMVLVPVRSARHRDHTPCQEPGGTLDARENCLFMGRRLKTCTRISREMPPRAMPWPTHRRCPSTILLLLLLCRNLGLW
jgi:hypothetical protein